MDGHVLDFWKQSGHVLPFRPTNQITEYYYSRMLANFRSHAS
jgi:hypothetical protein